MKEKSMTATFMLFLVKLMIYSAIIYAGIETVADRVPPKFYYNHISYLVVFFFIVTALFHFGMLRNSVKGNRSIISYFMIGTAVKFFIYMLVMIGYALLNPGKATAFISNFFVIYLLLTVFEVSVIYSHFKSSPSVKTDPGGEKKP